MANTLEKIIQDKKETLNLIKKDNSLDSLEKKIKSLNFLVFLLFQVQGLMVQLFTTEPRIKVIES